MVTGFIIAAIVIGILGWMWRINLALNHPEKEKRLRELGRNTWNCTLRDFLTLERRKPPRK